MVGVAPLAEHHRAEAVLADLDARCVPSGRICMLRTLWRHDRARPTRSDAAMTVDELMDQQAIRDVLDPLHARHRPHGPRARALVLPPRRARRPRRVPGRPRGVRRLVPGGAVVLRLARCTSSATSSSRSTATSRTPSRTASRTTAARARAATSRRHDLVIGLRYVDRLERRDGEWRIADRVCAFDWSRIDPIVGEWEFPPEAVRGRRDRDDPRTALAHGPSRVSGQPGSQRQRTSGRTCARRRRRGRGPPSRRSARRAAARSSA